MAAAIESWTRRATPTSDGSVYFRIANFPEYGKLSHNDFSGNGSGARVDVDKYEKADARDFVLWKAPKDGGTALGHEVGRAARAGTSSAPSWRSSIWARRSISTRAASI